MAVVRAQSSPPYALIVFVFLTVVCAGGWIWTAVGTGEVNKQADDAKKELARIKTSRDTPFVDQLLQGAKNESAMGMAQREIKQLKGLIDPAADTKTVEGVAIDASKTLEGSVVRTSKGDKPSDLITMSETLNEQIGQKEAEAKALRDQVKNLGDQMAQMSATTTDKLAKLQKDNEDLQAQLTAATNGTAEERKAKDDLVQAKEAAMTSATAAWEKERIKLNLELQQAKQQLAKANTDMEQLRQFIRHQQSPSVALAPAGLIVRAQPGSDQCYINLGAKDRVMVGMRFSVHDPRIGVHIADEGNAKAEAEAAGKGGIEVMEVGPVESLCRITRTTSGEHMQQGDLIANPVYQNSKNHKNHFVVIGDFDLDGDGVATTAERDRVVHMITDWGGVIDNQVTTQTDYLVAGAPPASATIKGEDVGGSAAASRGDELKKYNDTITEAKQDSVPILNANRFLALVGYYNNTIVR